VHERFGKVVNEGRVGGSTIGKVYHQIQNPGKRTSFHFGLGGKKENKKEVYGLLF